MMSVPGQLAVPLGARGTKIVKIIALKGLLMPTRVLKGGLNAVACFQTNAQLK